MPYTIFRAIFLPSSIIVGKIKNSLIAPLYHLLHLTSFNTILYMIPMYFLIEKQKQIQKLEKNENKQKNVSKSIYVQCKKN